jgi:D-tyrosyl-tRNA(Tyr) deacylase
MIAEQYYNRFTEELKKLNLTAKTGKFGAIMQVDLVNDGPFTIILDSKNLS